MSNITCLRLFVFVTSEKAHDPPLEYMAWQDTQALHVTVKVGKGRRKKDQPPPE